MAIAWTVKVDRPTKGSTSGSKDGTITGGVTVEYKLRADDDGEDPTIDPALIEAVEAWGAPGLPRAGETMYRWGDKVSPWMFCRSKELTRDKANRQHWQASCAFTATTAFDVRESDLDLIAIPEGDDNDAICAAYPQRTQDVLLENATETIFEEQSTPADERKPLQLPTGNYYSQPFTARRAREAYIVTQFELNTSVQTVFGRLYTINRADVLSNPPHYWMVTKIDRVPVEIWKKAPGTGIVSKFPAYMMTYRLELSNRRNGWDDTRALVDNMHNETADDPTTRIPNTINGQTYVEANLKTDGTLADDLTERPETLAYQVQLDDDFSYIRGL